MLELKSLLSRTNIPAKSDPFKLYSLLAIFPHGASKPVPLNLQLIIDSQVVREELTEFIRELTLVLPPGSALSVVLLDDSVRSILKGATVEEVRKLLDNTNLNSSLPRAAKISSELLGMALEEASANARRFATEDRLGRIALVCARPVDSSNEIQGQKIAEFIRSIALLCDRESSLGLDVVSSSAEEEGWLADLALSGSGNFSYAKPGEEKIILKKRLFMLSQSSVRALDVSLTGFKDILINRVYLVGSEIAQIRLEPVILDAAAKTSTFTSNAVAACWLRLGPRPYYTTEHLLLEMLCPTRIESIASLVRVEVRASLVPKGLDTRQTDVVVSYVAKPVTERTPFALLRSIDYCTAIRAFLKAENDFGSGNDESGFRALGNCKEALLASGENEIVMLIEAFFSTYDPSQAIGGTYAPAGQEAKPSRDGMELKLSDIRKQLRQLKLDR